MMSEQTQHPTEKIYNDPISVAQRTRQRVHFAAPSDKTAMLLHIVQNSDQLHAVVVTKTKRVADTLAAHLNQKEVHAASAHGSKRAQENDAAAKAFNAGELSVIITTDMVLPSLSLSDITHLISYDLPTEPEYYLNRMGCLNEVGEAVALVSEEQEVALLDIERVMRQQISEEKLEGFEPAPFSADEMMPKSRDKKKKPRHRKKRSKKSDETEPTER